MQRVFLHLSIRTGINCFSNLNYSSLSHGLDHTGQPTLPTCINQPWSSMTLSPVHRCSFLGPFLIAMDYYSTVRTGNTPQELQYWSRLAITIWPLSDSLKSLHVPTFPASNLSNFENKMFTCYLICDEETISVINFTCLVIMLCLIGVYTRFWQDCTTFNTLSHTISFAFEKTFPGIASKGAHSLAVTHPSTKENLTH